MTPEENALLNGEAEIQRVFQRNALGNEIAWIASYINKEGEQEAMIGMNYSLAEANKAILIGFLKNNISILLSLSVGFMLLLMVRRRIILSINTISESVNRFARDTQQKPESFRLPYRDRIGEIVASYEKMTRDIIGNYEHIDYRSALHGDDQNHDPVKADGRTQSRGAPESDKLRDLCSKFGKPDSNLAISNVRYSTSLSSASSSDASIGAPSVSIHPSSMSSTRLPSFLF